MAGLRLEHIYKVYPNGTKAVSDFTMNIEDQEFIVFVGPSGCGKSTTLRMIAGLEDISAGELYIDDKIVNDVEPKERDIAMVFQNYALYPHMTVYENMAFGLTLRHVPKNVIHEKVLWAAKVLDLTEYLDRKPKAMSGGQRQRVALGRAILRNPKVMLLDEPLSNLDAKLRAQMRSEIAKLHDELKTTFIYVTHDQVEAMTLGTRVVVMKLGKIMQIDTPKNLYDYPNNLFVAGFIGTPQMNTFQGRLKKNSDSSINVNFEWSDNSIVVPQKYLARVPSRYLTGEKKVYIGLRCEDISIEKESVANSKYVIDVKISHFEELGNETLIYGDINMCGDGYESTSTRVIIKGKSSYNLKKGDVVKASIDPEKMHLFDFETEQSIKPRIPAANEITGVVTNGVLSIGDVSFKLPKALNVKDGKYDLSIPLSAVKLSSDKKAPLVEVQFIENIENKKLAHIKFGEETGFANIENELKEYHMSIDFKLIVFSQKNSVVVDCLQEYDRLNAVFMNYLSAKQFVGDKYDELIRERQQVVLDKFNNDKKLIEDQLAIDCQESQKNVKPNLKEENAAKLAEQKNSVDEQIATLKEELKSKTLNIIEAHKANVKKITEETNAQYKKIRDDELASFEAFKLVNKDKDAYRKRAIELKEFKNNHSLELNNELNKRLSLEAIAYESEMNTARGNFKRQENPVAYLTKDANKKISELKKKFEEDYARAGILFFFKLNDLIVLSSDAISNKMIQGLGIKVFTKQYYVEIPHDAYYTDENGTEVIIKDTLDYGESKYALCDFVDGSVVTPIYVEFKELPQTNKLRLNFDITKVHITEKSMDIKIY